MHQNCDASYGTKRLLKARINEHRNHINRNTIWHFVITEYRTEHNYDFDWNDIKILDEEQGFNKLVQKIHIKETKKMVLIYKIVGFII